MITSAPIKFDDLLSAYEWVSSSSLEENKAFISRITGNIHLSSSMMDLEEELPEDIDDGSIYVSVPHKYELNLGKNLALTFAQDHLEDLYETISNIFRHRGAYGKYKDLLARKGQLDAWYKYETNSVEFALRKWATELGLIIVERSGKSMG